MTRRTETIDIGKGIQYAKVAARLAAFHEDNGTCDVKTSCKFKEGFALFSVSLTTKKGTFSGHSMGKVSTALKAFEKLETIAVGRALAFAGYLSSGAIASQDEMEESDESTDGITLAAFNELKRTWLLHKGDVTGKSKAQLSVEFGCWVAETASIDIREAGDWKQWRQEDLDACMKALTEETK